MTTPATVPLFRSTPHGVARLAAPGAARLRAACAMALLAAGVHLAVAPGHLKEGWPFVAFFLAVGAGQVLLAWLLASGRSSGPVLLAAIWGTVGLMVMYVLSRTVGLPLVPSHNQGVGAHVGAHLQQLPVAGDFGYGGPVLPSAGIPSNVEAVGVLDLASLAAEFALVVLLVGFLPARLRRWSTKALVVVGYLGLAAGATGYLG